jgi:hypothetical protein
VDNIKVDLGMIKYVVVDWVELAQDKKKSRDLVDGVINLRVR